MYLCVKLLLFHKPLHFMPLKSDHLKIFYHTNAKKLEPKGYYAVDCPDDGICLCDKIY